MKEFFEAFNYTEVFSATMVLFAVIDIIGSIPIIIRIKEVSGQIESGRITIVSLVIMIAFLFVGEGLLSVFGVNVGSFAVAGAFILFVMALEMILGIEIFKEEYNGGKNAGIVPLAFPLIAGAGSMTTIISIRAEYESINIIIAILINMAFVFLVLKLTRRIEKLLGPGGIAILKKVFGIILLAIAVKLFASNIMQLIN